MQQLAPRFEAPLLFLYRNRPSVHLGRFQNPWLECRPAYLEQEQITLLRRLSGGGTVYHDLDNLNLCMIWPQAAISQGISADQRRNALLEAVKSCVHGRFPHSLLEIGDKYDLLLRSSGAKVSGSAFRETRQAQLHHLTLLMGANLDRLSQALRPALTKQQVSSLARDSRRAKVQNLCSAGDWCWEQEALEFGKNIQREMNISVSSESDLPWSGKQISVISVPVHPCSEWEHIIGGTPKFQVLEVPVDCQIAEGRMSPDHYEKLRHFAQKQPSLERLLGDLVYSGINSIRVNNSTL